jgi:hypothetical protein
MEKIEATISNPEHTETLFEYLTRIRENIPTYTQEDFLLILNQLSYIVDSYRKTFLFNDDTDVLRKQNESLQAKLDKCVKDNKKLVKALKVYANTEPYLLREDSLGNKYYLDIRQRAKEVLEEVEEEE